MTRDQASVGKLVKVDLGEGRLHYGIIIRSNPNEVLVHWEDDQTGLLYWDHETLAWAGQLEIVE